MSVISFATITQEPIRGSFEAGSRPQARRAGRSEAQRLDAAEASRKSLDVMVGKSLKKSPHRR